MRTLCISVLLFMATWLDSQGQSNTFDHVKDIELKNFSAIKDNNEVKGYFMFYFLDKASRNENLYALIILDDNLKQTSYLEVKKPNDTKLLGTYFNGEAFCFAFLNPKGKSMDFALYDKELKLKGTYSTKILTGFESISLDQDINEARTGNTTPDIIAVSGKGFIRNTSPFEMFDNTGKVVWKNEGKAKPGKTTESESAIYANENACVGSYFSKTKVAGTKVYETYYIFHNTSDGKELFRVNMSGFKFMFSSPDVAYDKNKDEYIISGEYFKKGESVSDGFFMITLDNSGTVTRESYSSWKEDIGKLVQLSSKRKLDDNRSIFVHKVIRTEDGKVFAICEQYKKALSGIGMASMAFGGGIAAAKVELYDMMVFEFDSDLKIQKVNTFEKEKTDVDLPKGLGLNGSVGMGIILKMFGWFDYEFTTISTDRKTFNVGYVNYDKSKEDGRAYVAGSISYSKDQTLVQDKIKLKDKPTSFSVLPSKPGYIAIFEYFEKEKKINIRLEKLNI